MHNRLKHELHDLISGKSQVRFGAIIQAIASYLSDGLETSSAVEGAKQIREQERKRLEVFISENEFWLNSIDFPQYKTVAKKTNSHIAQDSRSGRWRVANPAQSRRSKKGETKSPPSDYFLSANPLLLHPLDQTSLHVHEINSFGEIGNIHFGGVIV